MTSCINLFIYEVVGPKITNPNNYNILYSFNKLQLRTENNNNSPILPRGSKKEKSNNEYLFSKNIIKSTNKDNEIKVEDYNNIPFLYQIYKKFIVRQEINKIPINQEIKLQVYNKIESLIKYNKEIFENYFIKNFESSKLNPSNESELIYNIYEKDDSKIIITGDNHGSFHSFFRIILRLYIKGIITKDYKLKENYKIILLGDLIDRGNYSIEILYILLNLMKTNNTDENLNVILIRGNHEEEGTSYYYGFYKECITKFQKKDTYNNFIKFFNYCPSAIILNQLNTRYWLCHGGFSIKFEKYYPKLVEIYKEKSTKIILIKHTNVCSSIRWADFTGENSSIPSKRGAENVYDIGNNDLKNFLDFLSIDFIIRGHTDNESNAMLLKNKDNDRNIFFYINKKENIKDYINKNKNTKDIIKYNIKFDTKPLTKSNNELAIIYPKNFNKNAVKINNNLNLFPVLTISNNSDRDRLLYPDSYIIISKSKSKSTINNSVQTFKNNDNAITNRGSFFFK